MKADRRRRPFPVAGRLHDRPLADNNPPVRKPLRIATLSARCGLVAAAWLASATTGWCAETPGEAPAVNLPPAAAPPSTLARIDAALASLQATAGALPESLSRPGPDAANHTLEEDIRQLLLTPAALERIAALRAAAATTVESDTALIPPATLNPLLGAMTEQVCRLALLRAYWSREAAENTHRDLIIGLIRQLPETERSPAFDQLQALPAADRSASPLRQRLVPDVDCIGLYRSPAQIAAEAGAQPQLQAHNTLRQQLAQRLDAASAITRGNLAWTPRGAACPAAAYTTSGNDRPRVLQQPDVQTYYPPRLRERFVEGVVRVGVRIDAGGCVTAVMIRQSSGATELDSAGMRLVFDMQFTPAERDGAPVGSSFVLPVRFSMAATPPAQP